MSEHIFKAKFLKISGYFLIKLKWQVMLSFEINIKKDNATVLINDWLWHITIRKIHT